MLPLLNRGPFLGAAVAAGFYRLLKVGRGCNPATRPRCRPVRLASADTRLHQYLELKTQPEPIGSLGKDKEPAQLDQGSTEDATRKKKRAHKVEATGIGGGLLSGPEDEQGVAGGEPRSDTREVKERLSRIEDLLSNLTPVRTNYSMESAKQGFSPGSAGETKPTAEYFDHVSYNRV